MWAFELKHETTMRLAYLLTITTLLSGCAKHSLMKSGTEAEYNRYYIAKLRIGMTEDEVWDMMGRPYKIIKRSADGEMHDVWYYVTKGKILGQTKVLARNLTPLVFRDRILKGWGRRYYNYVFDVDNARALYESREKQRYTNDRHEWPPEDHGYVPSPHEKEQTEKSSQPSSPETEGNKAKGQKSKKNNSYARKNKRSFFNKAKKEKQSSSNTEQQL